MNIVIYILSFVNLGLEKDYLGWSFIVFLFYFLLEDVPLMTLMTLVHAQKGEKERAKRATFASRESILNPTEEVDDTPN